VVGCCKWVARNVAEHNNDNGEGDTSSPDYRECDTALFGNHGEGDIVFSAPWGS
jgi:hypothetical protein